MPAQIIVTELSYFPPIQFFTKFLLYDEIRLEAHEHYVKRTYRNRCVLAGSNGPLRLTIPLRKGKNRQKPIREVEIAYDEPWQQLHWNTITSCYGKSPFFEHYEAFLAPFFTKNYRFLFDMNLEILEKLKNLIPGLKAKIGFTEAYDTQLGENITDFRNKMTRAGHGEDAHFQPSHYAQVFEDKHGFMENLSILDLLFCAGPESYRVLKNSSKN